MLLFDSHTHLESSRFDADRPEVIARAMSAGVTRMVTCGADLATSEAAIQLARTYPGVYAAVGVHAHEARSLVCGDPGGDGWLVDEVALARLAALASQPGVVAWGEIGLDYHYDFSPRPVQRAVLARQLVLACERNLPVILHNRESDADLCHIVDAAPQPLRGVLHCFLGDQALAEWALARGLYIGVAGPITFKQMEPLLCILRTVPRERLLIETDCPYLAPHPRRGRRNEPAFIVYVAQKLAEVLGISREALAEQTTANACRLFGVC